MSDQNRLRKGKAKEVIVLTNSDDNNDTQILEPPPLHTPPPVHRGNAYRNSYANNEMSEEDFQRRLQSGFFQRQGPVHVPAPSRGNAGPSRTVNNRPGPSTPSRKRKRGDLENVRTIQQYMNVATGSANIAAHHQNAGSGPHRLPVYRVSKAANNTARQAPVQEDMENDIACTGLRNVRVLYGPVADDPNIDGGPPWRLHRHQIQAVCLLLREHVRGALLLFSMGAGKSLTAIACIDNLRRHFPGKYARTVILAPAAMLDTWESEMQRYAPIADVGEIHVGSHNSFDNMPLADIKAYCKNSILVIDEVHNARNCGKQRSDRIAAGGRAAGKIILLSGTPIFNRPSDIAPILDMIKPGCMPTSRRRFGEVFGPGGLGQQALMRAALSCAVLAYKPPDDDPRYPRMTVRDTIVNMVPAQVLAQELNGSEPQLGWSDALYNDPDPRLMRFYDTARSICNSVVFENGLLALPPDVAGGEYNAGSMQANHVQGGRLIVCPKLKLAVAHLRGQLGAAPDANTLRQSKTVFFTHWVNLHGAATLKMLLDDAGIVYGEIVGSRSTRQRTEAIRAYNADELHVLILSDAGGEGLNLIGTRFFHMLEPQWSSTSENQAIARAVRFRSHSHLPQNEQHVQVFRYLCVAPGYSGNTELGRRAEFPRDSGDTFIRDLCIRKDRLNEPFEQLVREVAQDNAYHCFQRWNGA
jgi:superfamily II DNA or RNA helicase